MDEDQQLAQSIKVSILRLAAISQQENIANLKSEDWEFGEDQLVLLLGRLNTPASLAAFVDLFDYQLGDVIYNSIGQVSDEYSAQLIPLFKNRIGKPIQTSPYMPSVTQQERDRQLSNWVKELQE